MKAELLFVYLGGGLPRYARSALEMAVRDSRVPVRFLSSWSNIKAISTSCSVTPIEDFYSSEESKDVLKGLTSNPQFRGGLWVHSLERFLVLDAYARAANTTEYFHAELDCLTFGLDRLLERLRSSGHSGLFLPFDKPHRAIASLIFVNEPRSIENLIQWARSGVVYANEMELLAMFAKSNPTHVFALPTVETLINPSLLVDSELVVVGEDEIEGFVDAASLGQWIGGIDPRNLRPTQAHRIHFLNESIRDEALLRSARFWRDSKMIKVSFGDRPPANLYCIHLHSKSHEEVESFRSLDRLLRRAGGKRALIAPGGRRYWVRTQIERALRRARNAFSSTGSGAG